MHGAIFYLNHEGLCTCQYYGSDERQYTSRIEYLTLEPFGRPSKISDFIPLNGYFQEFCKRLIGYFQANIVILVQKSKNLNKKENVMTERRIDYTERKIDFKMCKAAADNNVAKMKLLKSQGANFNAPGLTYCSPMHEAARNNAIGAMKWLKSQGADINEVDTTNHTSMHQAALGNAIETMKWLKENGVEIDIRGDDGATPMQVAVAGNWHGSSRLAECPGSGYQYTGYGW